MLVLFCEILRSEFATFVQSNVGLLNIHYVAFPGVFLLFVCHVSDLAIGKIFVLHLDTGWISTGTNGQSDQDFICPQHQAKLFFSCLLQVINGST